MKYEVYVAKKQGFDVEASLLSKHLAEAIPAYSADSIHLVNHYLLESESELDIESIAGGLLSEPNVDVYSINDWDFSHYGCVIPVRYLPGQYDQRADSAAQCIQIASGIGSVKVRASKIYCFYGHMPDNVVLQVEAELINPVESMRCELAKLSEFEKAYIGEEELKPIDELLYFGKKYLQEFIDENSLAMSAEDLTYVQEYFKSEDRAPNMLELKALDTYWSDHCRHTTFNTPIGKIGIHSTSGLLNDSLNEYHETRRELGRENKALSLMDLATINARKLTAAGNKHNVDISEEINACSIKVNCKMQNGSKKPIYLMFKNETHNHPTEIEPFGGAATCLGGAIRDPLSGRAYVYGAMRITGAGDPTKPREDTIEGKLPQYRICKEAAHGYSSYGNQIGLATGLVREFYHEGFLAKRFELGAVIASVPRQNVRRKQPALGDIVVLIGGRTGRDGVGGATGSSKSHTEDSLQMSGSEVQKGNAPTERKLQRLFMNPEFSKMIKRCNDFGAGGVAVAVGEIADSIDIDLDKVPKKYEGLSAMDTAISESQERMAVVIKASDWSVFDALAHSENLEATPIAKITDTGRLRMFAGGKTVLDLSRDFLDSSGVKSVQDVEMDFSLNNAAEYFAKHQREDFSEFKKALGSLENSSQKGLIEMFDASIGAASVFSPLGGKTRLSPNDVMVNKIPVGTDLSETMSAMSYGFDPKLAQLSPFHGAYYAVIMSIASIVAAGFSHKKVKLSFQEYFEKLGKDAKKWGKPFMALLGAMKAQNEFNVSAIGGKDSMSGSFGDINVPPSLVSFAVSYGNKKPISTCMKNSPSKLYVLLPEYNKDYTVDSAALISDYNSLLKRRKSVLSAKAINHKGLLAGVFEMAVGNKVGVKLYDDVLMNLPSHPIGAILVQSKSKNLCSKGNFVLIGELGKSTLENEQFEIGGRALCYNELIGSYTQRLESVYPSSAASKGEVEDVNYAKKLHFYSKNKIAVPRVFIPVFPGTNCELDTARAFKNAGAQPIIGVFKNERQGDIEASIDEFEKHISNAQILAIPGGFSAGDEPEGSAKFISAVFKNPKLQNALNSLIKDRDGLVIGICNGFQALIKLGIFDKGEFSGSDELSPTLTYNTIGRHVAGISRVRISSTKSPWLKHANVGDIYNVAVSHGEGRFVATDEMLKNLIQNGQVVSQYVDDSNHASMDSKYNLNGSTHAVESLISIDGRVLGKMGHTERYSSGLYCNIDGEFDTQLFKSGVEYFL